MEIFFPHRGLFQAAELSSSSLAVLSLYHLRSNKKVATLCIWSIWTFSTEKPTPTGEIFRAFRVPFPAAERFKPIFAAFCCCTVQLHIVNSITLNGLLGSCGGLLVGRGSSAACGMFTALLTIARNILEVEEHSMSFHSGKQRNEARILFSIKH